MGLDPQPYLSSNLPARTALEGEIVGLHPTPGKYGHAEIAGVPFGVTKVSLRLGAVIFTCTLMSPARFAFDVQPGTTARVYGTDETLIVDYLVPGVTEASGENICHVRPGDLVTIDLPVRLSDIESATPEDRRTFNNRMHAH